MFNSFWMIEINPDMKILTLLEATHVWLAESIMHT